LNPPVGCVILAAGQSLRFGSGETKLLLPFGGLPLLQRAVDAVVASSAAACTLVLGAHREKILDTIDPRRCSVIANGDWRSGITSSIRAGLKQHLNDDACIFMVADQPFIATSDLDHLILRHAEKRMAIVALRNDGTWGTPVLFVRSDYPALLRLHGDTGAKQYAARCIDRVEFVESSRSDAFSDIDTPEDYSNLTT
jgi:molybdenum cofactor cytidylyltransferase